MLEYCEFDPLPISEESLKGYGYSACSGFVKPVKRLFKNHTIIALSAADSNIASKACSILESEWGRQAFGLDIDSKMSFLDHMLMLANPGSLSNFFIMINADEDVVGVISFTTGLMSLELGNLVVATKYRGKGHGKTLMEFALKHVENNMVSLKCNDELVPFYQKFGFVRVDETLTNKQPNTPSSPSNPKSPKNRKVEVQMVLSLNNHTTDDVICIPQ
jgi:predicted GNAT family N-acyltransferase